MFPVCCKKRRLAAHGYYFCASSRWSATQSLWEARILPTVIADKNLSLLNVGSLGQFDDLYGNDHCGFRNRGWLLLPIVYAFALIKPGAGDLHAQ
ncbi:hypothetical protein [Escherichia coli]|uniref:hypothetical protein n=1 Tax=Escherichia coli TaxID=562 RepID=UPI00202034DD|nr:hypothetical protein [Escherichia coli]